MWGGMNDWELIKSISSKTVSYKTYFKAEDNNWNKPRVGLNGDLKRPDFIPKRVINPKLIDRYYTREYASELNSKTYRNINKEVFNPPFVVMKKGQHKKLLAASYIDYFSYCTTSCYVFNGNVSIKDKKGLVSLFNSKLTTYLLFLTSASWGIEREQVFMDEILESPSLLPLIDASSLESIVDVFDEILSSKKSEEIFATSFEEDKINTVVFNSILGFPKKEVVLINDCLNYSLDLFDKQEKSKALFPVLQEQVNTFSTIISNELNNFIDSQSLFANATIYNNINRFTPLMMIKISFDEKKKEVFQSNEFIDEELKRLDQHLWEEKATNIYFRKKLNYKSGNDIYIIRPNQRRFWSQSMALEDASELILEILNGN